MKNVHLLFLCCILVAITYAFALKSTDQQDIKKLASLRAQLEKFYSTKKVRTSSATKAPHLVIESTKSQEKRSKGSPEEIFEDYILSHPEYGIKNPKEELVFLWKRNDHQIPNWFMLAYQQIYKGLIVDSAVIKALFNVDNQIISVSSQVIPDIDLPTVPVISSKEAIVVGRTSLPQNMSFDIPDSTLLIYRTGLTNGVEGTNHLAYRLIFTCSEHYAKHYVYVDALTSRVVNSFRATPHALNRTVYTIRSRIPIYTEGQATNPGSEVEKAVSTTGSVYSIMYNVGGFDSWDLNGGVFLMYLNVTSRSIEDWNCPNAAFYQKSSFYCPSLGFDVDIVGHEWGHAYVDSIAGLIYEYQSGALNEGFADVIGETLQLLLNVPEHFPVRDTRDCYLSGNNRRWIMGDISASIFEVPNSAGQIIGIRDMYNPNCFSDPTSTTDPRLHCSSSDSGGVHSNSGIPNQGYTLFVDGGIYNNQNFTGVGLIKAFHVYIRGLTKHIPSTTFTQHADFILAACQELVSAGINLKDPLTGVPSGEVLTSSDCTTLSSITDTLGLHNPFCTSTGPPTTSNIPGLVISGPFPRFILPGETIIWETKNFDTFNSIICIYNYLNGSEISYYSAEVYLNEYTEFTYCLTPVANTSEITVSLSYDDGLTYFGPYPLTVVFVTGELYFPTSGPEDGGTLVSIIGSGFVESSGCNPEFTVGDPDCLCCLFGDIQQDYRVPATFINSTTITCISPSWYDITPLNKTVDFYVMATYWEPFAAGTFRYVSNTPVTNNPPTPNRLTTAPTRNQPTLPSPGTTQSPSSTESPDSTPSSLSHLKVSYLFAALWISCALLF